MTMSPGQQSAHYINFKFIARTSHVTDNHLNGTYTIDIPAGAGDCWSVLAACVRTCFMSRYFIEHPEAMIVSVFSRDNNPIPYQINDIPLSRAQGPFTNIRKINECVSIRLVGQSIFASM